jgi:hypothetical protein
MVAMQQHHQDNNVQSNIPTKSDNYVQESIPTSSSGVNTNVSSSTNDDTNNKNSSSNSNLQSNGSSSTMNQSTVYSTNPNPNKIEQKNICTVNILHKHFNRISMYILGQTNSTSSTKYSRSS